MKAKKIARVEVVLYPLHPANPGHPVSDLCYPYHPDSDNVLLSNKGRVTTSLYEVGCLTSTVLT